MKKKIFFIGIAILFVIGAGFGYYQYNRKPADVASLNAKKITASNLFKDYSENEQHANALYLNNALEVSGKVLEVKQASNAPAQVILDTGDPMFGVACTMDKANKKIQPGENVTIKGICTGYLNDVILIRSLLINQQ
jgi:hypothetical protein